MDRFKFIFCLSLFTLLIFLPPLVSAAPFQETSAVQENAAAYQENEATSNSPNYFLKGAIFIGGLLVIWFVFYYMIYPFLLKYHSAGYSKRLFWSLVLLFSLSWLCICSYVLFEIGFYLEWLKYVYAFIGGLWFIWFLTIMFKKDRAYY